MEQAVVALGVEETRLVKPGSLELMVDVGGNDEVVPSPLKRQQSPIRARLRHNVPTLKSVQVQAPILPTARHADVPIEDLTLR